MVWRDIERKQIIKEMTELSELIKSQVKIKSLMISVLIGLFIYVFEDKISMNDIKSAISSLITFLTVIFAIYGITLSILSGLHDTNLVKRLLRNGSKSRKELQTDNKNVLNSTLFSIIIFILIQVVFSWIVKHELIYILILTIGTNSLVVSIISMKNYFIKISDSLFNYTNHN